MSNHGRKEQANRNVMIALESFLSVPIKTIANSYQLSEALVHTIIHEYEGRRNEILKCYFTNNENRAAVADEFAAGEDARQEELLADRVDRIEKQLERTERTIASLLLVSQTMQKAKPPTISEIHDVSDAFRGTGLNRQVLRAHVTGQATKRWRELFGCDAHGLEADDEAIRKRIIAIYFNGKLEGKGVVWTITGVNRYAMEGVRLSCCLQNDAMYISEVERLPLTDI